MRRLKSSFLNADSAMYSGTNTVAFYDARTQK